MKKPYSQPTLEFVLFTETDAGDILTNSNCSTPDTEYYEGVNTYAGGGCFDCTDCD